MAASAVPKEPVPENPESPLEALLEKVVGAQGDLEALSPEERKLYYTAVCQKLGLDPSTLPFFVLRTREGQMRLYLNRGGAEALRQVHGISIEVVRTAMGGPPGNPTYYEVVVEAQKGDRREQAVVVADLRGKRGVDLENAVLAAETKAKRRATISILALGSLALDETEALSMVGVQLGRLDPATGAVSFPEETRPIREDQVREVAEAFASLGSRKKEANRLIASLALGREVSTLRDLSEDEAEELLSLLREALKAETPILELLRLLQERGANPEAVVRLEAELAPF